MEHAGIELREEDGKVLIDNITFGSPAEGAEIPLARIDAAVARALPARYLKRIAANLANVMSSVVLPVDQMDSYRPDADGADEDT